MADLFAADTILLVSERQNTVRDVFVSNFIQRWVCGTVLPPVGGEVDIAQAEGL